MNTQERELIKKENLFSCKNPFRPADEAIVSPLDGIVIGRNLPLVTESEGLYHIARLGDPEATAEQILHYY
ncbi:MAG: hypothetical protein ACUVT0_10555, partial [Thermochromatium sp.]